MTWSYDTALTTDKDRVRLLVGDTDTTDQLLQDEEIAFLLLDEGSYTRAAATAAETIAARYARDVDYTANKDMQELASQRQSQYLELAKRLRQKAARTGIKPVAGGISRTQRDLARNDPDRIQPAFWRGMETEPGTEPDGPMPLYPYQQP